MNNWVLILAFICLMSISIHATQVKNAETGKQIEYAYQKGRLEATKQCNSRFDEVIRLMPQDLWNLTYPGLSKEDVLSE